MILLHTVSGKEFYLNNELIYRIDLEFDSIITLMDGKTLRVRETGEEIRSKVLAYKQEIFATQPGGRS